MRLKNLPGVKHVANGYSTLRTARNMHKRVEESLAFNHNEIDPKEMAASSPPKGEKVELHSVWVTEAYPPSMTDGLIRSIRKLGWDVDTRHPAPPNSFTLAQWVQHSRRNGGAGAWINAGVILSPDDNSRFPVSEVRRAKLPDGVDYGYIRLYSMPSSLTLVTIQFVLKDEFALSLNEPLQAAYKTKVEYRPSKWRVKRASYIGAMRQKRQAVERQMDSVHGSLYKWFHTNLPGYYSTKTDEPLPTIDFMTSRKYKPPKKGKDRYDEYTSLLLRGASEIWRCKGDADLELRRSFAGDDKSNLTLFGNFGKLTTDEKMKYYGDKNRAGLANKLEQHFSKTMSLWAMHCLLISYERKLSDIRDKASSEAKTARGTLKDLKDIRHDFLAICTDIRVVAQDLEGVVRKESRFYKHETVDFSPPDYIKEYYPDFIEGLRTQDEAEVKRLIGMEASVREAITASGSIASATANLRIQRSVFWLTVVVVVLTAISVAAAVLALDVNAKDPAKVRESAQKL